MDDITSSSLATVRSHRKQGQQRAPTACGLYLTVDVNGPNLPTAATGRVQSWVTMVTGGRKAFLVVELQHTLGEKSLS